MFKLDNFQSAELYDPRTAEMILSEGKELLENRNNGLILMWAQKLEEKMDLARKTTFNEWDDKFLDLSRRLKFFALPNILNRSEIISLFREHLLKGLLDPEIDLSQRLKARLLTIPPINPRDEFKAELLKAILRNTEQLTDRNLENDLDGTVENWLKDYIKEAGMGPVNSLQKSQYLFSSPNARNLSEDERGRLEKLLELFYFLQIPSMLPEGLVEELSFYDDEGNLWDFNQGEMRMLIDKSKAEEGQEAVGEVKTSFPLMSKTIGYFQQKYREMAGDLSAIDDKIKALAQWNERQLSEHLQKAAAKREVVDVLAVLRLLAQNDKLANLLMSDVWAEELLAAHFKTQNKPDLLKGLELNPANPHYLSLFLQYVFRDRLGLDEETAALYGMMLADLSIKAGRRDLARLVYYDAGADEFKWM